MSDHRFAKDIPFTQAEYARRLTKVRAAMAERELDALLVTDPSNMAWLTAYDGWSFYVHQAVIVLPDADPIWWGRAQDANGALRTVWMADDRVMGYADHFVQSTEMHPMQDLAVRFGDLELSAACIGVEMENYYYSAKAHAELLSALPQCAFADATALVNWCRAVKSDEELTFMRRAARISEKIIDGLMERTALGVPKNEVVAAAMADAVTGAEGHWGDYPAIVPLLPSGPDAAAPHLTWNGRPFAGGEATFFEISGCYRRYHAPLCRTIFLGTPPDFLKRAEEALLRGLLETWLDPLQAIDPKGEPVEELLGYVRRKLQMSRDFPRQSRLFANEIVQGAPRIIPVLEGELRGMVDRLSTVIEGWIAEGRLAPVDPRHLMFSVWSLTQHYADFDVQVRAVLNNDDPYPGAETHLELLFRRLLTP